MAEINVSQETGVDSVSIHLAITRESFIFVLLLACCRPSNSLREMLRAEPISIHLGLISANTESALS